MRAERGGRVGARTRGLLAGSILLILLMMIASPVEAQIGSDIPDSAGTTWELPTSHGFYINGTDGPSGLNRVHPIATGEPMGYVQFNSASGTILEISSAPATETVTVSGEASVRLYASLLTDNDFCRSNWDLSQARAESVAKYLKQKGVSNNIETVGHGHTRPIGPANTKAGRDMNRRASVTLRPVRP